MTRWARGQAEVEELVASRQLQKISGAAADGEPLLGKASRTLTTSGGHYAVEITLRAQFGQGFRTFGALRRRRNELEYPTNPSEAASQTEATQGIQDAHALLTAAQQLLPRLSLF